MSYIFLARASASGAANCPGAHGEGRGERLLKLLHNEIFKVKETFLYDRVWQGS